MTFEISYFKSSHANTGKEVVFISFNGQQYTESANARVFSFYEAKIASYAPVAGIFWGGLTITIVGSGFQDYGDSDLTCKFGRVAYVSQFVNLTWSGTSITQIQRTFCWSF